MAENTTADERVDLRRELEKRGMDPQTAALATANAQRKEEPPWLKVPVHEIELPSGGKVYPQGSSLHGVDKIQIRAMTAQEEDILTSVSLIRQGTMMSALLRSCIMERDIDPEQMLTGDRNAVLAAIRMSGYGNEYDAEIDCPECSESFKMSFDIPKITSVRHLGAEPVEPGTNLFEHTLKSGKKIKFRLMTGELDREFNRTLEKEKKARGPGAPEQSVTTLLFFLITEINGESDRGKLRKMIRFLPVMDAREMVKHIGEVAPGWDMKADVVCPHCGAEREVEPTIGPDFFWPDA